MKEMKKQFFSKKLLACLLVMTMMISAMGTLFVFADTTEQTKIIIVHTNDVHSRVVESSSSIGYAKMTTFINELREENPGILLLDAGDTLHGENIANLEEGESIVRFMNAMKYDAMVAGNHDFNYGQERLLELNEMANFPILGANVLMEDDTPLLQEYIIFELEGVKIGVFGLASTETPVKTHPNNVVGLTFADPVEVAKAMVEVLQDEVDVIIALAHLGIEGDYTSIDVANAVEGIDIIVDGHSHTAFEEGELVNDVLIVSTGEHTKALGLVEITIEDGKIVSIEARLIDNEAFAEVEGDEEILGMINETLEKQQEILGEVIGETLVVLDGERENVRTRETNLGYLITDAFLAETGAEIAMTNGGGIRSTIEAGEITKADAIRAFPFTNFVTTIKIDGSTIKEALEYSVRLYPEQNGGFLHVAGLSFSFDPSKDAGERVTEVTVNGNPLDMDAEYVVATHDFLAAGGDGYEMFIGATPVGEYPLMNEVLINYIQAIEVVDMDVEGRITAIEVEEDIEEEVVEEPIIEVPVIEDPVIEIPVVEEPAQEVATDVYVVNPGDVLWRIANKFGTTWEALQEMNQLKNPHLIFPGQKLVVPAQ